MNKLGSALNDFLIVLSEGFNVLGWYHSRDELDSSIKEQLLDQSRKQHVAFVVGLMENCEAGQRCNFSYILDATPGCERNQILSWKLREDLRFGTPSTKFFSTPIDHRGFGIASLICNDYMEFGDPDKQSLLADLNSLECPHKILCAPACSSGVRLYGRRECWPPDICVAVANGHLGDRSFINGNRFEEQLLQGDPPCEFNRILLSRFVK